MAATMGASSPKTPELSIVVPVYNGGEYFRSTVESLLNQTLDRSLFEVILVDDGSTDGSAEYCAQLDHEFPGFFRAHLQENSGSPAGPRNLGARLARGEYVFFVDADDLVPADSFEWMLKHAREKDLDIGLFKVDASSWNQTYGGLFDAPQDNCTVFNSPIMNSLGPYKLFRRSIIVDNDITFPSDILYEDLPFVLECYMHAERISIITDRIYYTYCARDDGGSISQSVEDRRLDERITGVEHYFGVAARYATPQDCPHIYTRGYRYLDYALAPIVKQQQDDLLKEAARIARVHYCDQVRSLLPFSCMTRFDVLTSDYLTLAPSVIGQQALLGFGSGPTPEEPSYEMRFLDERGAYSESPAFTAALPPDFGWGRPLLENPQIVHNLITRAEITPQAACFEGQLQLLRTCDGNPSSACLRTNHNVNVAASMSVERCENVYANVWHIVLAWSAQVPLPALELPGDAKRIQHLFLDLYFPNGERIESRFGKDRLPGVFGLFAKQAAVSGPCVLAPTETPFRNMSINVVPREIVERSEVSLALAKAKNGIVLHADGTLGVDNYPATRLELLVEDESGRVVSRTALSKGARRGDRRFSGDAPLGKLAKGRYRIGVTAHLGNGSVEIDRVGMLAQSGSLKRLFATATLEQNDRGALLVIA